MKEELLKGLTKEQVEKARACKSTKELFELAKEEGLELNDEQLEAVAGGRCDQTAPQNSHAPTSTGPRCLRCGSDNLAITYDSYYSEGVMRHCNNCGYSW